MASDQQTIRRDYFSRRRVQLSTQLSSHFFVHSQNCHSNPRGKQIEAPTYSRSRIIGLSNGTVVPAKRWWMLAAVLHSS
jgi:hypothetical protein